MPDSVSDPASRSIPDDIPARDLRTAIPADVRRKVTRDERCHYCGALWASVPDHVIPVAQGGTNAIGNLVPACLRCNAQKHDKTPAQWKAWRLEQGMEWPPPDCTFTSYEVFSAAPPPDEVIDEVLRPAIRAEYPPLLDALRQLHDRRHRNRMRPAEDDVAELLTLARRWHDEVTV